MIITEITYGSPQYHEAVVLRDRILREPLDLEYTANQISLEWQVYHIGAYSKMYNLVAILIGEPMSSNSSVLQIRQVAVSIDLQLSGIGKNLMAYSEALFCRKGYKKFELNSRKVAIPFYKKCGYHIVGDEFAEVGIPHSRMVKSLI